MDYIYYHLHKSMTIADVAASAALSPNYLNTLFRKDRGQTIQQYIRSRRIEAAKNMLRYSDYSVTEIASFLAFSTPSHFIRVFREAVGMTPKDYQARSFRKHEKWKR